MTSIRLNRTLVISVFVVASCGLAYELIMAALASYFCCCMAGDEGKYRAWFQLLERRYGASS